MYSLTIPQKNIWNLQKFYSDSCISNVAGMITFEDRLDIKRLSETINMFVKNNVGIRMRFDERNGDVYQYTADHINFDVDYISFSDYEQAREYFTQEGRKPFALCNSSMYRFCIYGINDQTGVFVCLNHLVSDAWTLSLFCTEIVNYYNHLSLGTEIETGFNYIDHINSEQAYFNSKRYAKDSEYWNNRFVECPSVSHIKPYSVESTSAEAERTVKVIDCKMTDKIKRFCSDNSISLSVLFESVIFAYLYRINEKRSETVIGTMVLNRTSHSEKQTAGMFVSTMPLGVAVSDDDTVLSLCQKVTENHWETFRHQKYPFSDILKNIRSKFNFEGRLFDVMVSCQNASVSCENIGFKTDWLHNGCSEIPFVLHIDDRDSSGCLTVNIDYQTEVFRLGEVEHIYNRIIHILNQFVNDAELRVNDISVIPDDEYCKIIYGFNDTSVYYPRDKCVHELFSEQAARTPDKTALVFGDEQFSYKQLDEMSNSLAHYLREKGIKPNDIVPIISKRSWHVIVAMLGVIKAGGAYMLLPNDYPFERINYMINEAKSKFVLVYESNFHLSAEEIDLCAFDYHYNTSLVSNINCFSDLYCALHTSGSTGKPKLSALTHLNLCNYICNNVNLFDKIDISISFTIISFDAFMLDTVVPVLNNVTIVIANENEIYNQAAYESLLKRYSNISIFSTPTKLSNYIDNCCDKNAFNNISAIFVGGEIFTDLLKKKIKDITDASVFNMYGPTETTINSIYKTILNNEITELSSNDITIGKPIANTQIYILDNNGNPCPIGVAGELCIAGDGVGKGYLNRPELTAEKFVANPFIEGGRMYKSGDLARWRGDGEIEYLGRIDTQIKIRGLRIELGEIESVLSGYNGISMCAVTDKKDVKGKQYLIGYYTSEEDIDERKVRQYLSSKLPKYMVPNYFMRLEAIPMTSSGKTDRRSLPAPDFSKLSVSFGKITPPETDTEIRLAKIWSSILNVENIGKNSDFTELGGDSLSAVTMLADIEEEFGIETDIRMIMEHSVLFELAECIENSPKRTDRVLHGNFSEYVLTPQQKAVYFACAKNPCSLIYNMPMFVRLNGISNVDVLKENALKAFNNHRILKSRITVRNGEIIGIFDSRASLDFEEYSNRSEFVRPFELGCAPLIRIGFSKDEMAVDIHHIVCDGESVQIILSEIFSGTIQHETIDYADYAEYLNGRLSSGGFDEHKDFFRNILHGDIEAAELPKTTNADNKCSYYVCGLDDCEYKAVSNFCKQNNFTETSVYFALYGLLMSKYTNRQTVISSIVLSNRIHSEISHTCGMFVNTIPAIFRIAGNKTFGSYMEEVKDLLLNLYRYQELPFLEICSAAEIDKNAVNTTFIYQSGEKELKDIKADYFDTNSNKFDLSFQIVPNDSDCKIMIEYDSQKYGSDFMRQLADNYRLLIGQIGSDKMLSEFTVLYEKDFNKVVYDFNNTSVPYNKEKCVQQIFEEQVFKAPDKTALVFEDKQFSYKQLDEMSNSLAHYLREKGIKPNDIVPIISKRSWHVIVAMLGVIKAGGAYMPVDPNYPADRIEYMISEGGCKFALVYGYRGSLPVESVDLVNFDYSANISTINVINIPDDTCYVIFTSGSTGRPKGTLLKHSGLVNFTICNDLPNVFHHAVFAKCSRILAIGSFSFDISIVEIFQPLLNGLCVVMADEDTVNSSELMAKEILFHNIDIIHTTPTRLSYYLENGNFVNAIADLKVILAAGEALSVELLNKLQGITRADIFNGYGPTETTVGCTFSKMNGRKSITVGKPIANVQIYILDNNGSPCPIGVAGELCIAGDGVGKGYLNRPELTAEKFVANPFIEGGRMYKSGDLARWREDGEIEYLGRIDAQVKIRGLRIELGEIESAISSFDGVLMSAAADKRDKNGRQYLVGYYTSDEYIDEKKLRSFLTECLPQYMIPNFFMRLDEIPVNISGKTDRKNLPEPDTSAGLSEYVPPRNERESILCGIAAKLLKFNRVGITDDFFEIGGDSLCAVEFSAEAHENGIDFDLQAIFEKRTISELCGLIDSCGNRFITYPVDEFRKFDKILQVKNPPKIQRHSLGDVLLTGVTGFLGAHILDSLAESDTGKIYCLVRSNSKGDGRRRLSQILKYYFCDKYEREIGKRIIPVFGDIVSKNISENMPHNVQTVIHVAATVKHYGDYSHFSEINVGGTENVLKYAERIGAEFIHISTVSISGSVIPEKGNETVFFDESDLNIGQNLSNVYLRSKFEAERLVLEAKLGGMNCKIFRIGNLTNRYSDRRFQLNYSENAFLQRLKAFIDVGAYPIEISGEPVEFSPVDLTAKAVIMLSQSVDNSQTVFHVNNVKSLTYSELADIIGSVGYNIKPVNMSEFENMLISANSEYDLIKNDLYEIRSCAGYVRIAAQSRNTAELLGRLGFKWCGIDRDYIKEYLEYFAKLSYWRNDGDE